MGRADISKSLAVIASAGIIVMVIVGLFNFSLMLEIWVNVFIGTLFAGVIFAVVKRFSG
jgi:hypothetical protein